MNKVKEVIKVIVILTIVAGIGAGIAYTALGQRTQEFVREQIKVEEKIVEVNPDSAKLAEVQLLNEEIETLQQKRDALLEELKASNEAQREELQNLEMGFTQVSASVE